MAALVGGPAYLSGSSVEADCAARDAGAPAVNAKSNSAADRWNVMRESPRVVEPVACNLGTELDSGHRRDGSIRPVRNFLPSPKCILKVASRVARLRERSRNARPRKCVRDSSELPAPKSPSGAGPKTRTDRHRSRIGTAAILPNLRLPANASSARPPRPAAPRCAQQP
jgi:hypothetical protein